MVVKLDLLVPVTIKIKNL